MHPLRFLLPLALFALAVFHPVSGQQQAAKRHYVVSYVDSLPNFAAEAAMLLEQYASDSRKDPGIVRIEVLRDISRANHFTFIEVWQSREAFEAHEALAHTKTFRDKIQHCLGSPFDERMYNILE